MATRIGSLSVMLSLNSSRFARDLRTTSKQVGRFAGRIAGVTKRIVGWGTAITAVAGGGGLGLLVKRSFQTMDATTKVAARLGLTTQALVGLHHAADLAGVPVNSLNMALQRMTRRVAEAAQGTGEAKAAIAELGLDASELAKLSPDQVLAHIADALARVTNQSDKVRLAFKLFDSEGVAVINMLRQGSKGLREAAKEAQRLGITFDHIGGGLVAQANDALGKVGKLFRGLGNQIAMEMSPIIEWLSNEFIGIATDGETMGARFVSTFKDISLGAYEMAADIVRFLKTIPQQLGFAKEAMRFSLTDMLGKRMEMMGLHLISGAPAGKSRQLSIGQWLENYGKGLQAAAEELEGNVTEAARKMHEAGTSIPTRAEVERKWDELIRGARDAVARKAAPYRPADLASAGLLGAAGETRGRFALRTAQQLGLSPDLAGGAASGGGNTVASRQLRTQEELRDIAREILEEARARGMGIASTYGLGAR